MSQTDDTGTTGQPSLSQQQVNALAERKVSVALSAGAGCGKTRVLTEHYLRLISGPEPIPLGRLVVLTFTDKAAREVRDRVRQRCRDHLAAAPDPSRWRAILRGLETAPIGTFHAYCAQVLRRFSIEAGLEPGFGILDETVAPLVREEAMGRAVRRWLASSNPFFEALAVDRGVDGVRDLVGDLIELRTRGELEREAERTCDERLDAWRAEAKRAAQEAVTMVLAPVCRDALTLLHQHETTAPKMRERRRALLDELFPRVFSGQVDGAFLEGLRETAKVHGSTAKHWSNDEALYIQVRDTLAGLRDVIESIEPLLSWDEAAARTSAEDVGRLARLAVEASADFDQAKRSRGVLDYDDLILRTRKLLDDSPGEVGAWVENSVSAILVDEYQDTDGLQHEIIRRLAGPLWADGRVFVVGDRKQSIYRFRGAEPDIFDSFQAEVPEGGRRHLTENYRSVPEIIDFVNALFAETFPGAEHEIVPGRGAPDRTGEPAVRFLWAAEEGPRFETNDAKALSVDEGRKVEARSIASLLRRWLAPGSGVTVRDGTARRPATAGDVAILFRSINDAGTYESALAEAGIDHHVIGGSAFYGQQEVLDLINLLTAIECPLDQVALAASLRGPFGGVSDDGLYWLSAHAPTRGDLSAAIAAARDIAGLSAADRRRAERLDAMLRSWRADKDRLPIARVVGRALDESGVEAAVAGEYLGERRLANLRKIERMARAFDVQGGFTLADFTSRLSADWSKPPREEQAATSEEQGAAVKLMTIHKAKGLEFPIVILPDLNRKSPPSSQAVGLNRHLGVVLRPPALPEPFTRPDAPDWLLHQGREKTAEEGEALRVFYVAATRARDVLVLSSATSPTEAAKSPAMKLLDRRFDRATGAFRGSTEGLRALPLVEVIGPEQLAPPEDHTSASPRRHSRLTPGRLAAAIVLAGRGPAGTDSPAPEPSSDSTRSACWPRRIDLAPEVGLSSRAARAHRLVRAVLDQDARIAPESVGERLLKEARREGTLTPRPLMEDALRQLDGTVSRNWWGAIGDLRGLRIDCNWAIEHVRCGDDPTIGEHTTLIGRIDRVGRGEDGAWRLIALSAPEADPARERLRLLASAKALARSGLEPISTLWRVVLGSARRERIEYDPSALDRDMDEAIDAIVASH